MQIASDLLNLFNPGQPGSNFDLGAVDVERERDLGIATLNQTRVALGLTAYTSFAQITDDPALAAKLQQVYGTVDNVDLFVGGLAETPIAGSMVGQTFEIIMVDQFENLRDGDRLFYENQGFSPTLMAQIENTTLSDLIVRDTDTTVMQADAFTATERRASNVAATDPTMPQLVIGIDAANAVIAATPGVANTLVAGAGANQTLVEARGGDVFVFQGAGHHDTVVGFHHGADAIDFEGLGAGVTFANVVITATLDRSTVISVGGDVIVLAGVAANTLSPGDFLFGISGG